MRDKRTPKDVCGEATHPLKRTNAQKTAPAQDTQQWASPYLEGGSRDAKVSMTAKQMSSSTIFITSIYRNTQKQVL